MEIENDVVVHYRRRRAGRSCGLDFRVPDAAYPMKQDRRLGILLCVMVVIIGAGLWWTLVASDQTGLLRLPASLRESKMNGWEQ